MHQCICKEEECNMNKCTHGTPQIMRMHHWLHAFIHTRQAAREGIDGHKKTG